MTATLLRTKLSAPATRPQLVPRPRLFTMLNAGLKTKLTLVSAPPGFGKTTLVGEWARQCACPVAWLSLDDADNDPARFLAYLTAAIQTVQPGFGNELLGMLLSPEPPSHEITLADFVNEITNLPTDLVIVLDDYHIIEQPPVQDTIRFILDNLPPGLHLVIATRADPPWPLARLRSRNELIELRAKDLRFTEEEAIHFFNRAMGLDLSKEIIRDLDRHTEGWIAGLQLSAISMKGRNDIPAFVKAFTGSNRFIFDYLMEEVLQRQSPLVTEFLLKTSFLDQLTAPLCDFILERADSRDLLRQIEQSNLFLIPLDQDRRWYRYHKLFADLLQSHLGQQYIEEIPPLQNRASEWYEQNERLAEAVAHALAAGNQDRVATLIEKYTPTMIYQRDLHTLLDWIGTLPETLIRSRPWLCLASAWVNVHLSRLEQVDTYLDAARKASAILEEEARKHVTGFICAIDAYAAGQRGDLGRGKELAQQALLLLPENDRIRSWAAMNIAFSLRRAGDLTAAEHAFSKALDIIEEVGDEHNHLHALAGLATIQASRGHLHQAADSYRTVLQLADQLTQQNLWYPITGDIHTALSTILREWNDLAGALHQAQIGMEISERWGQLDFLLFGYREVAFILQAMGNTDGANKIIEKMGLFEKDLPEWPRCLIGADKAELWLQQGERKKASAWLKECRLRASDEITFHNAEVYTTVARLLIAEKQYGDALVLLDKLVNVTEPVGSVRRIIALLVMQVMALQGKGKPDSALAMLEKALDLAEPGGYIRSFTSNRELLEPLQQAASRGIHLSYVGKLLAIMKAPHDKPSMPMANDGEWIEPLSRREVEILQLLSTGLSNEEIASTLVIAVVTVKKHLNNIYGKLNVHSRIAAVAKAQKLRVI